MGTNNSKLSGKILTETFRVCICGECGGSTWFAIPRKRDDFFEIILICAVCPPDLGKLFSIDRNDSASEISTNSTGDSVELFEKVEVDQADAKPVRRIPIWLMPPAGHLIKKDVPDVS